jgi:tRNA1(Val) A37 N6-methylase TrmN6
VTYTPTELADFVAHEMVREWTPPRSGFLRVLDPAVGDGQLLASLLNRLPDGPRVEVYGFDNDPKALDTARARLEKARPDASLHLRFGNFLASIFKENEPTLFGGLFEPEAVETFDLVIANPPYVRTQVLGAGVARALAEQFGLTGRVDLYHAFVLAIAKALRPHGAAGIILSNRFMTTKAGACVRRALRERLNLKHVWDLGDTKLFNAAVLPAVLVAQGRNGARQAVPRFTSIYETEDQAVSSASSITAALAAEGVVSLPDGRRFRVQHGTLNTPNDQDGIWRVATREGDAWLATVQANTWGTFRDLGKVRVGVKTCADKVFIRSDWDTFPEGERPELLRPLMTHHVGRRFRADSSGQGRRILYPHECVGGRRRAVDLRAFPRAKKYLEQHREVLQARTYVLSAGRQWYEIWVPQDPAAWARPKLIFRDISEEPCFWIDQGQSVVNGDCYWLICDDPDCEDLLWLAASVGNSTFIEAFYDRRFNNKLYAGRRRFITQYVEEFPLPDPRSAAARAIITKAKSCHEDVGAPSGEELQKELDAMVWTAFGLPVEEVRG